MLLGPGQHKREEQRWQNVSKKGSVPVETVIRSYESPTPGASASRGRGFNGRSFASWAPDSGLQLRTGLLAAPSPAAASDGQVLYVDQQSYP